MINLAWPPGLAILLHYSGGLGFHHSMLVILLPALVIGAATCHFAVRIVIEDGIIAVAYPFRLFRKTCLLLVSEVQQVRVRPGFPRTCRFYLANRTCVQLPFYGLSATAIAAIAAKLNKTSEECPDPTSQGC